MHEITVKEKKYKIVNNCISQHKNNQWINKSINKPKTYKLINKQTINLKI